MSKHLRPARFAAPAALLAAALAVYLVVKPATESGSGAASTTPAATTTAKSGGSKPGAPTKTATTTKTTAAGRTYRVQAGDTLSSIAAANDTTLQELTELNPDAEGATLRVGQELELPGTTGG